jgi:hypothetical protein
MRKIMVATLAAAGLALSGAALARGGGYGTGSETGTGAGSTTSPGGYSSGGTTGSGQTGGTVGHKGQHWSASPDSGTNIKSGTDMNGRAQDNEKAGGSGR